MRLHVLRLSRALDKCELSFLRNRSNSARSLSPSLSRAISSTSSPFQLRCQFSVISLADSPVFTALSYAWGDATASEPVTVDGGTIHVTVNLADALRDIYGHWSKGDLLAPGYEQWLWADALCIDQENVQEKNHQVPLMKEIYSKAYQVFAWLGNNDDAITGKSIDGINFVLSMIARLPGFKYIHEETKYGRFLYWGSEKGPDIPKDAFLALTDLAWVKDHYQQNPSVKTFRELVGLSDVPYWRRLWVLQELVLAKTAILLCGFRSINWIAVCSTYSWLTLCKFRHAATERPGTIPLEEWLTIVLTEIPTFLRDVGVCKRVVATRHNLDSSSISSRHSRYLLKSRYYTCIAATRREATDPKDFVYALGGISGLCMTVDYSPNTTAAKVYQEYFSGCVLASKRLPGADTGRYETSLCDLWFLTMSGIGLPWNLLPGLPSWTPNLKGITIAHLENTFCIPLGENNSPFASMFPRDTENASLLGTSLCCTAYLLDEVTKIGPIIQIRDVPGVWRSSDDAWLLWMYDTAVESTNVNRAYGLKIVAAIAQVLYVDKISREPSNLQDLAVQLLLLDMENACAKRGVTSVMFFESLGMLPPPSAVEDPSDDPSLRTLWVAMNRCPGIIGTAGGPLDVEVSHFVLDNERQRHNWNGCKLALTGSGLAGLFPPLIEDGDIVSVIHGYDKPAVLRKRRDGYQFVGVCRSPALANEEKINELRESGLRTERIKIY
ncbi:heterokaryon incompatibility protein-domain-containing protein [Paraphoma chrysanthemicola]|nr:heterokaryon incompatibility protein-domain-containing protein [Paraphoma chrysanthemicola]